MTLNMTVPSAIVTLTLAAAVAVLVPSEAAAQRPGEPAAPARPIALAGGQVIDGYEGPPIRDGVVLIHGNRITAVGPRSEVPVPPNAEVISTEGMSVLPGLMDMHVHLMIVGHADYEHWDTTYMSRFRDEIMPAAARQLLMAGVTTVRDLGAPLEDILEVRRRIDRGAIPGPRLFVSGPFIQKAPYFKYEEFVRWGVSGPDDARAKVQKIIDAGVDVIKLIDQDQMSDEEVSAVVQTAKKAGKPVVAHAHREDEIRIGLRHGVEGFEHTGLATTPEYPADIIEGLKRRNQTLFWCPTVAPLYLANYTAQVFPERLDDPAWQAGLKPEIVKDVRDSLRNITHLDYFTLTFRRLPTLQRKFQQLRDTGITLIVGTDSGIPANFHSDSTWRELDTWVRFGMTPMQAIGAATRWPARFLKREKELGTLAAGRLADVIAVRGDVLSNVSLLQNVSLVIKDGKRVK
jgi:imidazolonepropionase-like amidohydrolase